MSTAASRLLVSAWLAGLAGGSAGWARAQPAPAAEEDRGAEVEVTVRGESGGSWSSRASTDDAAREPVDAASMIASLPGVHVRRIGGPGSFGALSVRGAASTQVAVVLGAIPLTGGADPSFDVGSLPLWPGASFRVHRGFAPASLGTSGHLGGVLVIEPPSGALGARTETWAQVGSFGTLTVRASDVRPLGDGAVTAGTGVYASRSDGDFSFERPVPRTGGVVPDERTNASHAAVGAIERVAWRAPWGSVALTLLGQTERRGLPGTALDPTRFAGLETSRVAAGLEAKLRTSATGAVHSALWARRDTASFADPLGELAPTRSPSAAEDAIEAAGGSFGWRGRLVSAREHGEGGSLGVDIFADGRGERFVPEVSRTFVRGGRATRVAAGVGAEVAWRATGPLLITGSGRIDLRRDDASGAFAGDATPLGVSTEVAPTGHLGASLRLADGLAIAAHGGALRRPPGFVELYGDRGTLVGDAGLRPERAVSIDLGLTGDLALGPARFGAEVVGFATHAADLIAFVPVGRSSRVARNIDSAVLGGLEVSAAVATPRLSTTVGYTFLHTRNDGDDPLSRGSPLPGRPAHDLACDLAYQLGRVRARYGLDAIAGTTADAEAAIVLPARVLHGAELSVELPAPGRSELRLGVSVENLFDVRTLHVESGLGQRPVPVPVSDSLGFPLPGRAVYASARFRVGGP